jgi:hypothetical protein
MRCYLIILMVLAGCSGPSIIAERTAPADLFEPAPGWTGNRPQTERELILAAAAERAGRERANGQLCTLAEIFQDAKSVACEADQ